MKQQRIGIIMNGVTGRMGTNQHLVRSIVAIRKEGGVKLANGTRLVPDPILVGRNAGKVEALASAVHSVVERIDLLSESGPVQAFVLATNIYHQTAQGWRMVAHHASPGSQAEIQEIAQVPQVLH